MKNVCTTCGTDLNVAAAAEVERFLREHSTWEVWDCRSEGWKSNIPRLGAVEIIKKFEDKSGYITNYGEYEQGWTGSDYIVFNVSAGKNAGLYKKDGTRSSYGETTWDGPFKKVKATEKTVIEYTYEES